MIGSTPEAAGQAERSWSLSFTVNGERHELAIQPERTLLEVLREDLHLTGTKGACLEGECGSCIVLVDGVPQNSCLILAPQMEGREVVTIEGLADGTVLDPVQRAFVDHGAVQCGFCTPGVVLSTKALLAGNPHPTYDEVRRGLEGNICRCTGYMKVLAAALAAARAGVADDASGQADRPRP